MVTEYGGAEGNDESVDPVISAGGDFVAFATSATNLGIAIPTGTRQIVVWNRKTGVFGVASLSGGTGSIAANSGTGHPTISDDGSVIAFESTASNLTPESNSGVQQIFVRDLARETTTLVSIDETAGTASGGSKVSTSPSISGDGHTVTFITESLLTSTPTRGFVQAYARNLSLRQTTMISIDTAGTGGANAQVSSVDISADGTKAVFDTAATNQTPDHLVGGSHVFLRDSGLRATKIVSRDEYGDLALGVLPTIAGSGAVVAFSSSSSGVTSGLSSSSMQVFVRDLTTADTTLISGPLGIGGGADPGNVNPLSVALSEGGDFAAFTMTANNLVSGGASIFSQVYARGVADDPSVVRVSGPDRYSVAESIATRLFTADSHSIVFVTSGEGYPDALSASAAAASIRAVGAPVVLVRRDSVPTGVAAEILREGPRNVVIVGGPATVSEGVVDELRRLTGKSPITIDGANRYTASTATSAFFFQPGVPVAYVASGEGFADALAGGAVAGAGKGPVLLTPKGGVTAEVKAELERLKPGKIVVLGGAGTVSDAVVTELQGIAPTTRVAGADRFATAVEASKSVFGANTRNVYIASGETFPDALSASAAAAASHGPLLLVAKDGIPASVVAELKRLNPRKITVVGGPNTVSDRVVTELKNYLRKE
ncbi:cell wall-binding repeat-containing protein [Herbiconiux moechotypicola]|uniref:Cell wall-binding repeat-containing protein n=2 Tax=Herbiconiux moechotypicola TaxID=637393 RepID=A0ABP5Q6E1_9MICO|nr:cell wall-binding repeat-containing protein [Herbiconiux moechotypicola]